MIKIIRLTTYLAALTLIGSSLFAQSDRAGTSDHSLLTRYPGFYIDEYAETAFDQAQLITSVMQAGQFGVATFAGQVTNIEYKAEDADISAFQIISNYKKALADLNADTIVFCASAAECGAEGWEFSIFHRTAPDIGMLLRGFSIDFYEDYGMVTAKVEQNGLTAHVMILAFAQATGEKRSVYQSIVTSAQLDDDNIGIGTVEDVTNEMDQTGTVVLEGVLFDFDTANLTATSQETLDVVTDYLTQNSAQHFYVVGHTDSDGAYEYNVTLSQNRASSVIDALASRGISEERLTHVGIGPIAPVASNDSEAGKALNRRVELVLRP